MSIKLKNFIKEFLSKKDNSKVIEIINSNARASKYDILEGLEPGTLFYFVDEIYDMLCWEQRCVLVNKDWEEYVIIPETDVSISYMMEWRDRVLIPETDMRVFGEGRPKLMVFGEAKDKVLKEISYELVDILTHRDFDISECSLEKDSYMKSNQDFIGLFFHVNLR